MMDRSCGRRAESWQGLNYFNYFTEVEERFRQARGTGLFLLSPLDWALIENWKTVGIPLEAVLRGIDAAFEKWHSRKRRSQSVNSLAYCVQAVMREAQAIAGTISAVSPAKESKAPFSMEDLKAYLESNAAIVAKRPAYREIAVALQRLASDLLQSYSDLEQLEQRLSALEAKMVALARALQTEDSLVRLKQDLDRQLKSYRSRMSAAQLDMLERQYLERRLLEDEGLPRLSLFYLK